MREIEVWELDGSTKVEDSSRTKVEVPKQEEETPKKANLEKATTPKEEVPICQSRLFIDH